VWEDELPAESDELRQGDLIRGITFPKRETVRLTDVGIQAEMRPDRYAVVLDRCCTVEQRGTVMLAEVRHMGRPREGTRYLNGLLADSNTPPSAELRPALYVHLLEPHAEMPVRRGDMAVIDLLNRVSLILPEDERRELRLKRIARMTPLARAQLRWKLIGHFGRADDEDSLWLHEHGYDDIGRTTIYMPASSDQA
jgi:hypothetical protein